MSKITLKHITNKGISEQVYTLEDALEKCKEYMKQCHWLVLVEDDGQTEVITNIDFLSDEEKALQRISTIREIHAMHAIIGGEH